MVRTQVKVFVFLGFLVAAGALFYLFFPNVWGAVIYPLDFKDSISKYALQYNVRPNLIAGLIMQESGFNPNATSPVGARGLMQIMPGTGAGIARQLGQTDFSPDKLYEPDRNIQYGVFYIKQLIDKYNGNVEAALAAYNAGSARADAYVEGRGGLPKETQGFINRVPALEKKYDEIYDDWVPEFKAQKEAETKKSAEEEQKRKEEATKRAFEQRNIIQIIFPFVFK